MNKEHFNLIYEGALVNCLIEPNNRILYCEWLAAEGLPDEEVFKQEVRVCFELIRQKGCTRVLDNSVEVNYPILPHIQDWVVQYMQELAENGFLKKYALVVPQDMIAELSNEQIMDEVKNAQKNDHSSGGVMIRNFFNDCEAFEWLLL